MKISIFTPTNKAKYLLDAYLSIKDQNFDEWVIVLNGDVSLDDIHHDIQEDTRVKIIPMDDSVPKDKSKNIGAIKRFTCSKCTGDVLVELDHDDMLIAPAIEEIRKAFEDTKVVLAHSNCVEFHEDSHKSSTFADGNGWQYRDFEYKGEGYLEIIAPPQDHPHNPSIIYFAPNHFRAFRKTAYDAAGGYDENFSVLDDEDLMCRLFIQGEFYHVDKCCYMYRIHGQNSWLLRNKEIQDNVLNARRKYFRQMTEAWALRNNHPMIDLGGGFFKPPNYSSVDLVNADIVSDLNKKYPFPNNSIGVIRAHDFMEHVADKMHTLREIHRVLIPGGVLISDTPSTCGPNGESGMGAYQDPTHVSYWNKNVFWYVTRREQAQYIRNSEIRFKVGLLEHYFPNQWCKENYIPYVRADLICLKKDENDEELFRPYGSLDI